MVEPLGDTIDIHGSTSAGAPVVARIPAATSVAAGRAARFSLEADSIHLFEPGEFGASLLN